MQVGRPRLGLADGLVVVGASLAVLGVGRLHEAAGLIAAGLLLLAIGVLYARAHG